MLGLANGGSKTVAFFSPKTASQLSPCEWEHCREEETWYEFLVDTAPPVFNVFSPITKSSKPLENIQMWQMLDPHKLHLPSWGFLSPFYQVLKQNLIATHCSTLESMVSTCDITPFMVCTARRDTSRRIANCFQHCPVFGTHDICTHTKKISPKT